MTCFNCRNCGSPINRKILDLGFAPLSNAYISNANLNSSEVFFPLRLRVCETCWLVQTENFTDATSIFNDEYAYFSSVSEGWLDHAKKYSHYVVERFNLNSESQVVEIASNDGYLLRNFVDMNIPCLGVEPTASTATVAENFGIPVKRAFFTEALAEEIAETGNSADLIVGNNVYAHVPDINDFTRGIKKLLRPDGIVTLEFPHLMKLIEFCQFDTVYHEHFSYLSALTVSKIFNQNGLRIFDIEELTTHGGSLRIFGCHLGASQCLTPRAKSILAQEYEHGLDKLSYYEKFQTRTDNIKDEFLNFLIEAKKSKKTVAAYGAAAKGNTLLNYAGIKTDLLPFICDAAVSKQGKFTPGSHIPILEPSELKTRPLDYLVILPWNLAEEIKRQLGGIISAKTRFVTAVPKMKIL